MVLSGKDMIIGKALKKIFRKELLLAFLGVVMGIILVEAALRLAGFIFIRNTGKEQLVRDADEYIILCVGDSFTYGACTSLSQSYPRQLEELLNKNNHKKKFKVVNRGRAGNNTALTLNSLQESLKVITPDMVIVLAGTNYWNAWGYTDYLRRRGCLGEIYNFIHQLKFYKLMEILSVNLKNKLNKIYVLAENEKRSPQAVSRVYPDTSKGTADYLETNSETGKEICDEKPAINNQHDSIRYADLGEEYERLQDYGRAYDYYEKAVMMNPENEGYLIKYTNAAFASHRRDMEKEGRFFIECYKKQPALNPQHQGGLYFTIGRFYQILLKDDKTAYDYYKKAVELCPDDFNHLALYAKTGLNMHPDDRSEIINFLSQLKSDNQLVTDFIEKLKRGSKESVQIYETAQSISSDIEKMHSLCKDKGIVMILQDYPDSTGSIDINPLLREIARKHRITFVDNRLIFSKLYTDNKTKEEYLAYDGAHPNAKGYAIIAKNIYNKIIEEGLLPVD
jgi:lysophospholipase L1-like esterase